MQIALDALEKILGPKGFTTDPSIMAPWLVDWRGRYHGAAMAMLSPASTAEVAEIVKIASQYRLPLVPQGGNSGMVGGATPDDTGHSLLLSLRRMNAMTAVDTESGLVRCEAGVILETLHNHVDQAGRRFPLTLGGKGSATIGGLISTNAGGTQVLRHGTMRALVEGVEAVLPDSSIYNGLTPLKKDNRGYDIKNLLIGAEGTIGIVTGAVLRTVPAIIDRCVAWVGLDSPQDAYALLLYLQQQAADILEGYELMPDSTLNGVLRHIEGTRPPLASLHHWHVLIEFIRDQDTQQHLAERTTQLLANAIEKGLVNDAAIATSEAQAQAFWKLRDCVSEAERSEGPAVQHDISVPIAAMADFITTESPRIEAHFPGCKVVAFGHLGDGNIHYHVKAPADIKAGPQADAWHHAMGKQISGYVYDRVTAYNGSISAEHGIGQMKREALSQSADPARMLILRAIKAGIDPHNIMNPGKLVTLA